jgi:hypothetical protein
MAATKQLDKRLDALSRRVIELEHLVRELQKRDSPASS